MLQVTEGIGGDAVSTAWRSAEIARSLRARFRMQQAREYGFECNYDFGGGVDDIEWG